MKLTVACATDDGKMLVDAHFGEAKYYDVYELTEENAKFLIRIENTSPEERAGKEHQKGGDPEKASGVGGLLKAAGVHVMCGHRIGPNITRMKRKFVPVVSRNREIALALELIEEHFSTVAGQLDREEKQHFVLGTPPG